MDVSVDLSIRKSEADLKRLLFAEDFSNWLFDSLDFRVRERKEYEELPDGWRDVVHYQPGFELPALIKRALKGRTLGWDEHRSWSERDGFLTTRIFPNVMRNRCHIQGKVFLVAEGPTRTRLSFRHTVEVEYPFFGAIAARLIAADMRRNFLASEPLIHAYEPSCEVA